MVPGGRIKQRSASDGTAAWADLMVVQDEAGFEFVFKWCKTEMLCFLLLKLVTDVRKLALGVGLQQRSEETHNKKTRK